LTVGEAIEKFAQHLVVARGCKPSSAEVTGRWIRYMLGQDNSVGDFNEKNMQQLYLNRTQEVSPDTHQRELTAAKDFFNWCVEMKWIQSSPAVNVKPIGKRRRGKPQLRRAEAQIFYRTALAQAEAGVDTALAALSVLMLGLRAGEILERKVRDVDVCDAGVLLWIEDGKTDAATRHLEVPEPLAGLLVKKAGGRQPTDWLFEQKPEKPIPHPRSWLLRAVKRLCADAGVPVVCVHGLRGTWATLATESGVSERVVAQALGHTSPVITKQHYIKKGTQERVRVKQMLNVIQGGKDG
jgi:integrase